MEARRIMLPRPPPCERRLPAGKHRRDDASANSARKMQRREIGAGPARGGLSSRSTRERFRNIQLQEEFDTHDPKEKSAFLLKSMQTRSEVTEIFGAHDIIFALSDSGVCAVLSRETKKRICFANESPDQVIRTMFYNRANDSLITVSVYGSDDFYSCRTTPIQYIRQANPGAGFQIFETEVLNRQSFLEFDDVNEKILIYVDRDSIYKVFDMKNYTLLYTIPATNIYQIKFSPGILVLMYERKEGYISLEVRSIKDGKSLKSLKHLLHRSKPINFIEQFDEKLFIKQDGENLQILDIRDSNLVEVSKTKFVRPASVIFLQRLQLFLAIHGRSMSVWNYHGKQVTYFEDHVLQYSDCNRRVCISGNQDIIASYCRADPNDQTSDARSININDILTGKSLAKIRASDLLKQKKTLGFQYTPSDALMDVTALYYDEEHEEIYTGNSQGFVHMWSS